MQNDSTYRRLYEDGVDQLFGSRLENYRSPDGVSNWDDLRQKLDAHDNRRKKPVYGKWMLWLLLLIGTGAGAIYIFSSKGSGSSSTQYAQQPAAAPQQPENKAKDNKNNNNDNNTTNNNNPALSSSQQTNAGVPANSSDPAAISSNNHVNAATWSPGKENSFADIHVRTAYRKIKESNLPQNIVTGSQPVYSRKANNRIHSTPGKKDMVNNSGRNTRTSRKEDNDNGDDAVVMNDPKDEVKIMPEEPANVPVSTVTEEIKKEEPVKEQPAATASAAENNDQQKNIAAELPKVNKQKEKKTRSRREAPEHDFTSNEAKWYLEGFSGYSNSVKNSKSFAAFLAPSGYVEKRLKQENALVSMQAGVNVRYRKNHLILGSGISYLELGDMIRYDTSYSGPVALNARGRSKLTYLEIPLSAGYDWANKRWGFSMQGGVSVGLLVGANGQYVSVNSFQNSLFDLSQNKSIFRKTQVNLLLNPAVNYYMNEKTSIFVSPLYRLNLQPVTVTGASINQKYYGMGVRIGIRTNLR